MSLSKNINNFLYSLTRYLQDDSSESSEDERRFIRSIKVMNRSSFSTKNITRNLIGQALCRDHEKLSEKHN